ncbi:glycosyl hydrolase [Cohnella herbarum]|uniref:Glycoside hydrolase n=1 Tax=Cohnella herbarum TaxID=2728023 RepID=A0A7Z2VJR6_9BACL|nr:glycosyl hydrolase [Cohnella herbarum]QJD84521.1 hypothetical protein HH215_15940 [Cohnella herbarum]
MIFNPVRSPGPAYRGVNLWFLNDRLEDEELTRQLQTLHEAGCGAVIARTFDGLRTEYLSEDFLNRMRTIVEQADERSMKVYLQAGYMPGGIPELKPEHRACVIAALEEGQEKEPGDQVLLKDDRFTYVKRYIPNYINLLDQEAIATYLRQCYDQPWERMQDAFGQGIFSVWVDEPEFFPHHVPWSEQLLIRFEEKWGYRLQDRIADLFHRSESSYKVRYHYRRIQLSLFIEAYFEQVSKWCAERGLQFSGHLMGEDRLDSQIGYTVAAMPLYSYMQLPGIDHLTGNLRWTAMDRSGEMSIPFIMTPKQCSSIAHQEGKKTVLAELYGVSSQALTFQDQKRIAEYMAILGINHRCLHGSFYSMRGRRKRIYVPHLSEQQPWWEQYGYVSDYFARLSYALHQGTFAADALVIHPIESAYGSYDPLDFMKRQATDLSVMNDQLTQLSMNLMAAQIGFDYGDEHVMERKAAVDSEGSIRIGEMSYRTVILPMLTTIRESTLRLLERFVELGGVLIATSSFPTLVDCEESESLLRLKEKAILIDNSTQALRKAVYPQAQERAVQVLAGEEIDSIWVYERVLDDQRLVYVLNTNDSRRADVELRSSRYRSAHQYDLESGLLVTLASNESESVSIEFSLEPWQSKVIVFEQRTALPDHSAKISSGSSVNLIDTVSVSAEQMAMRRADPNAMTLDYCQYRKGDEPYSVTVPVIAVQEILTEEDYEGPVTLRYDFQAEALPSSMAVVVEEAEDYDILVNGTRVRYDGLPYYMDRSFLPIEITSLIVTGVNRIEMTRRFSPLRKTNFFHANRFQNIPGVELESIYLIGDFAVYGNLSERVARNRCERLTPRLTVGSERASAGENWPSGGYPFYSGTMVYVTEAIFEVVAPDERIEISLSGLEACVAVVKINGQEASKLAWKPFKADITEWVTEGSNCIEIHVTNTLRNLLGPHHQPKGETDYCYGQDSYSGRRSPETGTSYPNWHANRDEDTLAWTDDYFFLAYGLAGIQINRYSNK